MSTTSVANQPVLPTPASRIESVDVLRGLIMVAMALDHTRDYFHWGAIHGHNPLDLATASPWLFFTRWITHYCAPVFCFLAGTGVFLAAARGRSKRELSWFLLTRGAWLVVLELTFVNWAGWNFAIDLHSNWGLVLWSLGWSMIVLAGLVHLPVWAVASFGVAMIAGHNALDGIKPESWGAWAWLWQVLHVSGPIQVTPGFTFFVGYPLIPWIGVMAAGYGFGVVFRWEPDVRRRWLWWAGVGVTLAFVLLRLSNSYGNRGPWTPQPDFLRTLFSFVNCTKYPPSLCYLLMTLGPALIVLALLERPTPRWLRPFLVFGRVPFFYYLLHIPLIHGLAVIGNLVRFGQASFGPVFLGTSHPPPDAGFGLPVVYLVWLAVVVALYPACAWFAELKRRRRDAWLSYF